MGGLRDPKRDKRTHLYLEFARCLKIVQPKFFVAENVSGLKKIQGGKYLDLQQKAFAKAGRHGYRVTVQLVDAKDYGVPQTRERLFMVGVRRDVGLAFRFPPSTHGMSTLQSRHLKPYASHGDAIKHLPLWPKGEFYERPHNPEEHWSWYYMSRNRKAKWDGPSYTIVASFRHVTLHPGSSAMKRRLRDSTTSEQRWDFSGEYEHIKENPNRPVLKEPRRLSWRECAAIQTFPDGFEPVGDLKSKFNQIGNAVPPLLAEIIVGQLLTGAGLVKL
jgi:DNA (cytosine-5)-methyltransferase 1